MPCTRRIRGPGGAVVGVVGIEALLDRVLEALKIPDLDHQRRTILVDADARVVATEDAGGRIWDGGAYQSAANPRARIEPLALARKIQSAAHNGFVHSGDALFVFSRLNALDCYVVVELDAAATLAVH